MVSAPLIVSNLKYPLPVKMWVPFELNNYNYIPFYIFQSLRIMYTAFGCVGHDGMFFALCMRGCHQIELLIQRLKEFPNNVCSDRKYTRNRSRYDVEKSLFINNIRHLKMIHL